ncbi:hypothetical protein PAMP_001248 [Pampus punctatissimus]
MRRLPSSTQSRFVISHHRNSTKDNSGKCWPCLRVVQGEQRKKDRTNTPPCAVVPERPLGPSKESGSDLSTLPDIPSRVWNPIS